MLAGVPAAVAALGRLVEFVVVPAEAPVVASESVVLVAVAAVAAAVFAAAAVVADVGFLALGPAETEMEVVHLEPLVETAVTGQPAVAAAAVAEFAVAIAFAVALAC